jgi:hypothetical protein
MLQAVLTADIVNSTGLTKPQQRKLLQSLERILAGEPHEFFRGDSFQVQVKKPANALALALLCRTAAIALEPAGNPAFDIRVSIGIGKGARSNTKPLWQSNAEAFVLSGRAFDTLQSSGRRLTMATGNTMANEALQLTALYADTICTGLTARQAATVHQLLQGHTQLAAARKLKKSASTIHQHLTAARWTEMATILQHYQNMITLLQDDNN